jgi:DNA-directed RNA polymerase subunit RPC12/RpoP
MSKGQPRHTEYEKDERYASRKCLHCGRFFGSHHAGNRICPRCSNREDFHNKRSGLPEHGFVK